MIKNKKFNPKVRKQEQLKLKKEGKIQINQK